MSKGWAGLRARGVAGSISGMSSFAQGAKKSGLEPSSSWSSGLVRKASRERFRRSEVDLPYSAQPDGPVFQQAEIKRPPSRMGGKVFGRDIVEAGRKYGVSREGAVEVEESEWERRRKACLPALVVRTVEYRE